MDKNKTALEAATSLAKFMMHRLTLGVSKFSFNQDQLTELVTEAREYTEAVRGQEIDSHGDAMYGIFHAFRVFDSVEPVPVFSGRRAPLLVEMNYSRVLEFYSLVEQMWTDAITRFATYYPNEISNPMPAQSASFGVLSSLSNSDNHDKPVRAAPNRSMGEIESSWTNLHRQSLLDEAGDPGITLSIEKAKELGINTGDDLNKHGLIDNPLDPNYGTDLEKQFDPANPHGSIIEVILRTDSRQCGMVRLAHLIARAIAEAGYENVSLTSTMEPGWEDQHIGSVVPEMEAALKKVDINVSDVFALQGNFSTYEILPPALKGMINYTSSYQQDALEMDVLNGKQALNGIGTSFTKAPRSAPVRAMGETEFRDPSQIISEDIERRKREIVAALKQLYPTASHEAIELFVFGKIPSIDEAEELGINTKAHKLTDAIGGGGTAVHITDPMENDVTKLDPWANDLSAAQKLRIWYHCKENPDWFFKNVACMSEPYRRMKEANPTANRYGSQAITIYTQPGEPFFVLLGRDPQSPDLVDQWATDRNQMEMGNYKVAQAMDIADLMRSFKENNPGLGMSQNLYKETLSKELMHLVPRTEKYTEEEILRMAMIIAEAAIMSDVALNIQNNTCFTHLGKENPVDQQIAQVAKLASDVGFYFTIVKHDDDGNPIEAWGNHKLLEQTYSQETIRGMTLYAPGEYKDMDEGDLIEVPGLDN